jgi:hypothetical protein
MLTSGRSPRCWGLIRVTMLLAATQLPPTQANLSSKSRESAFIGYSESGRSVGHKCVDHEMECASYAQVRAVTQRSRPCLTPRALSRQGSSRLQAVRERSAHEFDQTALTRRGLTIYAMTSHRTGSVARPR